YLLLMAWMEQNTDNKDGASVKYKKIEMVNARHKEFMKPSTSKGAKSPTNDADHEYNENGSSSSSEDLDFRGQTTDNLKVIIQKGLEEFKKGGIMNDLRNEMATYRDFMACDVPKFNRTQNPIASTRWLSAIEGAFHTSCCKEKKKVNFASNFLRYSAKMWWDGKIYEKGEEWIGSCTWNEFKELFNAEYAPAEEVDKIQEEFQTLIQTNETVNELWNKFNNFIPYCPDYHRNDKLKIERFQRILRDDIREVISPFKCTTLDDLLSRAHVREADLLRKKCKEIKEAKRKLELGDRDAKKPKHDHGQKSDRTLTKTPSKPLKSIKEEKVVKVGVINPKAHVYVMAAKEDKVVHDVVTGTILVNSIPARVLYDSGASVSFISHEFRKNLSTPPNKLSFPLEVEIVDNKVVVVNHVYNDVEIEIDDSTFKINLIPIVLGVFDIDYLKRSVWYLDSSYSRHMTGVKQYMHRYSKEPSPKVVFGDDSSGDTEGYGSVNCNGITFTRVAYVNDLRHNLISIS
ncbi:zinc finger, CCHC-type, retrotransposon gag domain protein, partial [Tanacetum coccineum]